jgi:hypothetical protein
MVCYQIFLAKGKNKGSDVICDMLQRNKMLQPMVRPIFINSRDEMIRANVAGFPALRNESGVLYGSAVIDFLKGLTRKNTETNAGSCEGTGYGLLDDDTVSFNPAAIKSPDDFIIPSNPIGNNDIDIELAKQQAEREAFDAEFSAPRRTG